MSEAEEKKTSGKRILICALFVFIPLLAIGATKVGGEFIHSNAKSVSAAKCLETARSFINAVPEEHRAGYGKIAETSPELALRMNCTGLHRISR